jgi:flotillin
MVAIGFWGVFGLFLLALFVALIVVLALNYRKVGPNEVLIVSGGLRQQVREADGTVRTVGYKMRIGGGAFVLPLFQTAQILPLETYTVQAKVSDALTKGGVQLNAVGQAQLKVGSSEQAIRMAAEQFLGGGAAAIRDTGAQVMEGTLRAYLGSHTVEDIYQQRDEFNDKVEKATQNELRRMGLDLLSFTLIDISDNQGYLEALGKPKIAAARRDAEIAEAETDKEAAVKTAEARKTGDIARLVAETEVARANRDFESARAGFAGEVNQKKAEADIAYELERQRQNSELKSEELNVRIVERTKLIELEELEIARREKELTATVHKTAEARNRQVHIEAEAEAYKLEAEAKGRAAASRLLAEAEADSIRMRGEAEAKAMEMRAESYKEYNEAAIYQMLIEKLPELARAVSEPLSRIEKIVIVDTGGEGKGAAKVTGQVAQVLAQLPEIAESLGGIDLKKLARRLTGGDAEETGKKDGKVDEKKEK